MRPTLIIAAMLVAGIATAQTYTQQSTDAPDFAQAGLDAGATEVTVETQSTCSAGENSSGFMTRGPVRRLVARGPARRIIKAGIERRQSRRSDRQSRRQERQSNRQNRRRGC